MEIEREFNDCTRAIDVMKTKFVVLPEVFSRNGYRGFSNQYYNLGSYGVNDKIHTVIRAWRSQTLQNLEILELDNGTIVELDLDAGAPLTQL